MNKIISRKEAIKKKLTFFYTGKVCKNGHLEKRYTVNSVCILCEKKIHKKIVKKKLKKKVGSNVNEWILGDSKHYWEKKLKKLKAKCKKEKMKFNLDVDYMEKLVFDQNGECYYSKAPLIPSPIKKDLNWKKSLFILSIDKQTPKLGYVKGNVKLVSHFLNVMKGTMSHNEFISLLKLLTKPKNMQYSKNPVFNTIFSKHIKIQKKREELYKSRLKKYFKSYSTTPFN